MGAALFLIPGTCYISPLAEIVVKLKTLHFPTTMVTCVINEYMEKSLRNFHPHFQFIFQFNPGEEVTELPVRGGVSLHRKQSEWIWI